MPKTTITGPKQVDRSLAAKFWDRRAELLWGLAAAVLLFTFVDPVLLVGLALASATIAAAWLGIRELVQSATRDDAKSAADTRLRPASAGRPEQTSAHAPWRGHHAA
ncbi:MAG: hypothetical protein WBV80_16740 [Mycobacterium sp.]